MHATTYELHPLCTLFPRLNAAEFAILRNDIATHGLRSPIVLHDGMILDGGNRYRACVEAEVEPRFETFAGGNLVSFVLSANLHRRHMSAGQQAAIVASATDWGKAQTHGGDRKADQAAKLPLDTVATRAATSGASPRTQRTADKLAREAPELAKEVARGDKSLNQAAKESKPSKILPRPEPAAKIEPAAPEPVADDEDHGPSLSELVDELAEENKVLLALIESAQADDLKAEAIKWRKAYERAVVAQSEAMDSAARSEKREVFNKRQLMRCGKAVGEDDPRKIAAAVEAAVKPKTP